MLSAFNLQAQIPTTLTDKIYQGSGSIDLLKDVSAAGLESFLSDNGGLLLGVDINENASGNESSDSVGVAIEQMELVITTTEGTFSFTDFYTSTTAMIQEAGTSTPQEFYTMFGKGGSSQLTGGTSGFDLGQFDDVVRLQNVSFEGDLLSASLNVTFLSTAKTSAEGNESFFDYSGGFEDFALLGAEDAAVLEAANFGVEAAPSDLSYTEESPTITLEEAGLPSAPGAPTPPLALLVLMAAIVAWKAKRDGKG
jgi:hypothetical protein